MPMMTPLLEKILVPVPPLATGSMPDRIMLASKAGISVALRVVPETTRPLVSTFTFGYAPA